MTVGSHLFMRIMGEGQDSRFEEIRYSPPKFLGAFIAQATWVTLCALPVLTLNSLPVGTFALLPRVTVTDVLGLSLFIGGLAFEMIADRQKSQWSKEKREKKQPASAIASVPQQEMILVTVNDRLGTKKQVPCLPSDTIKDFKAVVAMMIGRRPHEILLKRQSERPFKDFLTLQDYGISNNVQLDLEVDTGD